MNVQQYLERIGFSDTPRNDPETLRKLQRQHLLSIPFENLDIHTGKEIVLDVDRLFQKMIVEKRGGFCYELNALFYHLLRELGFKARMVSARVSDDGGGFGPKFDHMAILVRFRLGLDRYLTDVGFGKFSMEPLRITLDKEQEDDAGTFRIRRFDKNHLLVEKADEVGEFQPEYLFSRQPRALGEYELMLEHHQTSPESHFTQNKICTVATPEGRITLKDDKFIEMVNGERKETLLIGETEFNAKLEEAFGITL